MEGAGVAVVVAHHVVADLARSAVA
jgi:hypothetical protein